MAAIAGALSEDDLRRAARGSIYVRAAKIVLQYFNHEHNRLPDALGDIQLQARQWCVRYFGARTFAEIPLHQHPKINRLYGTGEPLSYELDENAPDNPWLLFHPDAFNLNVAPWRRFSDERAETSRAETTTMKDYYEEPYEFGVLKAQCITARKLNDVEFRVATQHIRYSGALNRSRTGNTIPDNLRITADDLWRDQAIVRYLPEFMVWLGHPQASWSAVTISNAQRTLYKNKNMIRSGKMFFGRAEKVRLRQGGDGPLRYREPRHRPLVNRWRRRLGKPNI